MRILAHPSHLSAMTYLLTFGCYGCYLPGEPGWVDRKRGYQEPSPALAADARGRMQHARYTLTREEAFIVLEAIQEVCRCRDWGLIAAHIRCTHAHAVVETTASPHRVIGDFKAYASRRLNLVDRAARWAGGGNAARLSSREAVEAAVKYVADQQGEPMAVLVAP
jgi:REP element-mobilizing transposase RayT